ncbi:MAG: hypothetical protein HC915_19030, partial [Anaerolineae bacterium]|nr:hypothetical protein [Anaerolineae bacterium]
MSYLIGLDIGTTGCKAALFQADGVLLAKTSREYSIQMPQPGWAEQDAERVWALAQATLHELVELSGVTDVLALGISAQGEAVIPVDAQGTALRPAILGMDTRTEAQNAWLRERLGAEQLFEITGMPVHTINTLPKLLWLRLHEPDLWRNAAHFLLYEDFLIHKLTGERAVSHCLASRTQLFDLRANAWPAALLAAGSLLVATGERHEAKVLYDEYVLGLTALQMHTQRELACITLAWPLE